MPPKKKQPTVKSVTKKANPPQEVITLDDDEDDDEVQIVKTVTPKNMRMQKNTVQPPSSSKVKFDEDASDTLPADKDSSKCDLKPAKDKIQESAPPFVKRRDCIDCETPTTSRGEQPVDADRQPPPSIKAKKRGPIATDNDLQEAAGKSSECTATVCTPKASNALASTRTKLESSIASPVSPTTSTSAVVSAGLVNQSGTVDKMGRKVSPILTPYDRMSKRDVVGSGGRNEKKGEPPHPRFSAHLPIAVTHPTPSPNVALNGTVKTVRFTRAVESGEKNEKTTEIGKGSGGKERGEAGKTTTLADLLNRTMGTANKEQTRGPPPNADRTGVNEAIMNTVNNTRRVESGKRREDDGPSTSNTVQKNPHKNAKMPISVTNGTTRVIGSVTAPPLPPPSAPIPSEGMEMVVRPIVPPAMRGRPPKNGRTMVMRRVVTEETRSPLALPPPSNKDFMPNPVARNRSTSTVNPTTRVTRSTSRASLVPPAPLPSTSRTVVMGGRSSEPTRGKKTVILQRTITTTTTENATPPTANQTITKSVQVIPEEPVLHVYHIHKNFHDLYSLEAYFNKFPGFDTITVTSGPGSPTANGVVRFKSHEGVKAVLRKGSVHNVNGRPLYTSPRPTTDERAMYDAIGAAEHERKRRRASDAGEGRQPLMVCPPPLKKLKTSETLIPTEVPSGSDKPVDPRQRKTAGEDQASGRQNALSGQLMQARPLMQPPPLVQAPRPPRMQQLQHPMYAGANLPVIPMHLNAMGHPPPPPGSGRRTPPPAIPPRFPQPPIPHPHWNHQMAFPPFPNTHFPHPPPPPSNDPSRAQQNRRF